MRVVLCLTTCPDRAGALRIAATLIEERLAACVNVLPGVSSVYRWRGAVEQSEELQLFIKTTHAQLAALQTRLRELHPYAAPEPIVLDVADGFPAYLAWVGECVATDSMAAT